MVQDRIRHKHFQADPVQAVRTSRGLSSHEHDTYFALANFKIAQIRRGDYMVSHRKQSNVESIRALILDVDYKDYGDAKGTLEAFMASYKKSTMPPPSYIVNSGGGFHIYWLLEEPMTPQEHRQRASRLVNLFKTTGLKADYGCTVDCARVLRLPGTMNYKYKPAREVCIYMGFSGWTPLEALDRALGIGADDNVVVLNPDLRAAIAKDTTEALGAPHKNVVARFDRILEQCPTASAVLARHGEGDSYNLWKNILHLAAYTVDGSEFIHDLSSGHKGYNQDTTNEKFQESVKTREEPGSTVGPTTCELFNEDSPECQTCRHFGKIKSPISFGSPTETDRLAEGEDPTFIRQGSTYRNIFKKDPDHPGSYVMQEIRVAGFEISDFIVARYGLLDETTLTFSVTERDHTYTVSIATPDLGDSKSSALAKALSLRSIMMGPGELIIFREALMAWINTLRARAADGSSMHIDTSGYGWCQHGSSLTDAFAYAGTVYHSDGRAIAGPPHSDMADIYCRHGSLKIWKRAAASLIEDPRIALHAVLAASFAAPLMRYFPDTPSFTLSLVSPQSGVGKTTALRVAASVWAEPIRSMRQLNDTANAMVKHITMARDMPAYWDDIRGGRRVDDFLEIMFQLTQGREKERLSRAARLQSSGILRTILTVASNSSVMDRISDRDRTSDATARRVLEFRIDPMVNLRMDQRKRDIFHAAKTHYGHAGDLLAAWLPQNETTVTNWIKRILRILQIEVSADSADRFWIDACAAIIVGALIAKRLKLVDFDVPKLTAFLVAHIRQQKVVVLEDVALAAEELLATILFTNQDNLIRCQSDAKVRLKGRPKQRLVVQAPRGNEAAIEINMDSREVLLSVPSMHHFLNHQRSSTHTLASVISTLEARYKVIRDRRCLGRGTPFSGGQKWCRVVQFASEAEFMQIVDTTEDSDD
jgi:hypothetical protein